MSMFHVNKQKKRFFDRFLTVFSGFCYLFSRVWIYFAISSFAFERL